MCSAGAEVHADEAELGLRSDGGPTLMESMGNMTACSEMPAYERRGGGTKASSSEMGATGERASSLEAKGGAAGVDRRESATDQGACEHVDAETGAHGEGLIVDVDGGD